MSERDGEQWPFFRYERSWPQSGRPGREQARERKISARFAGVRPGPASPEVTPCA